MHKLKGEGVLVMTNNEDDVMQYVRRYNVYLSFAAQARN